MDEVHAFINGFGPLAILNTPSQRQHLRMGCSPTMSRRMQFFRRPIGRPLHSRRLRRRHNPRIHDRQLYFRASMRCFLTIDAFLYIGDVHVLHPGRADEARWVLVYVFYPGRRFQRD